MRNMRFSQDLSRLRFGSSVSFAFPNSVPSVVIYNRKSLLIQGWWNSLALTFSVSVVSLSGCIFSRACSKTCWYFWTHITKRDGFPTVPWCLHFFPGQLSAVPWFLVQGFPFSVPDRSTKTTQALLWWIQNPPNEPNFELEKLTKIQNQLNESPRNGFLINLWASKCLLSKYVVINLIFFN